MQAITEIQENTHQATNRSKHDADDLRILSGMQDILSTIQDEQSVHIEQLNALANYANQITYNNTDPSCVRNKYGNIDRSKSSQNHKFSIPLTQIAWLELFDTSVFTELREPDKNAIVRDLSVLKQKIDAVCQHLTGISEEDINFESLGYEDALIKWIECHYAQRLINKLQEILDGLNLDTLDFSSKEDRYTLGALLIKVGELCKEMCLMNFNKKDNKKDIQHYKEDEDFLFFKDIRNKIIHANHGLLDAHPDKQKDLITLTTLLTMQKEKVREMAKNLSDRYDTVKHDEIKELHVYVKRSIRDTKDSLMKKLSIRTYQSTQQSIEKNIFHDSATTPDGALDPHKKVQQQLDLFKKDSKWMDQTLNAVRKRVNKFKKQGEPNKIGSKEDLTLATINNIMAEIDTMFMSNKVDEKNHDLLFTLWKQFQNYQKTFQAINEYLSQNNLVSLEISGSNIEEEVDGAIKQVQSDQSHQPDGVTQAEKPCASKKVVNILNNVLDEIKYLREYPKDNEKNNQCVYIAIFCQAKIGQWFRDIKDERKKLNRSDALLNLISSPLLNDSIYQSIRLRNKGIAHEVLKLSARQLFTHILEHTGILETSIQDVLSLYDFIQKDQGMVTTDNIESFTKDHAESARKYQYLGLSTDGIDLILKAIEKINQYKQYNPDYDEKRIKQCELDLYYRLGSIYTGLTKNSENQRDVRDLIPELVERLPSLAERHYQRADVQHEIVVMYIFIDDYSKAMDWLDKSMQSIKTNCNGRKLNADEMKILKSAYHNYSICCCASGEIARAENAIIDIPIDTSDEKKYAETLLGRCDQLLLQCAIHCKKPDIRGLREAIGELNQLLLDKNGTIKTAVGAAGYWQRLGYFVYYLINSLPVMHTTFDEVNNLVEKVLWIRKNSQASEVLDQKDAERLSVIARQKLGAAVKACLQEGNEIEYKERKRSLYDNIHKLHRVFNLNMPLAEDTYYQAMLKKDKAQVSFEEKLECLTNAISEAENHIVSITNMQTGAANYAAQGSDTVEQYRKMINHCIRVVRSMYTHQYGTADSMVKTFTLLKEIAISSLQSQSKTTFELLNKMAETNDHVELMYGIDPSLADESIEAVKLIEKRGGKISEGDKGTQTLKFSMSPKKLTTDLLERLGLCRTAITNTVSDWIKEKQDRFSDITLEANCVTTETSPYVEASYFLIHKRSQQQEVNNAIQENKQPNISIETEQLGPGI